MLSRLLTAALCGLALLPAAAPASASTSPARHAPVASILRDCTSDGTLDHHYRGGDLLRSLRHLPADIIDYSNCADLVTAQHALSTGRPGTDPAHECHVRGTLRHRYSERRLRAALRGARSGAPCRAVLRAQLVGWTKPVWPAARRARR